MSVKLRYFRGKHPKRTGVDALNNLFHNTTYQPDIAQKLYFMYKGDDDGAVDVSKVFQHVFDHLLFHNYKTFWDKVPRFDYGAFVEALQATQAVVPGVDKELPFEVINELLHGSRCRLDAIASKHTSAGIGDEACSKIRELLSTKPSELVGFIAQLEDGTWATMVGPQFTYKDTSLDNLAFVHTKDNITPLKLLAPAVTPALLDKWKVEAVWAVMIDPSMKLTKLSKEQRKELETIKSQHAQHVEQLLKEDDDDDDEEIVELGDEDDSPPPAAKKARIEFQNLRRTPPPYPLGFSIKNAKLIRPIPLDEELVSRMLQAIGPKQVYDEDVVIEESMQIHRQFSDSLCLFYALNHVLKGLGKEPVSIPEINDQWKQLHTQIKPQIEGLQAKDSSAWTRYQDFLKKHGFKSFEDILQKKAEQGPMGIFMLRLMTAKRGLTLVPRYVRVITEYTVEGVEDTTGALPFPEHIDYEHGHFLLVIGSKKSDSSHAVVITNNVYIDSINYFTTEKDMTAKHIKKGDIPKGKTENHEVANILPYNGEAFFGEMGKYVGLKPILVFGKTPVLPLIPRSEQDLVHWIWEFMTFEKAKSLEEELRSDEAGIVRTIKNETARYNDSDGGTITFGIGHSFGLPDGFIKVTVATPKWIFGSGY